MKNRRGKRIGPWTLGRVLGRGGNGYVRLATSEDGKRVALKVLHRKHQQAQSRRYKRFRDEIRAHLALGPRPGILPVVDSCLPDRPSPQSPAWLATEVAKEIRQALGPQPSVEMVVEAMHSIAHTLASLHAEGISHRDLKPSNLFQYEGRWVLGDFGLVEFPGKEELTAEGERLGPSHFIAPEMISSAKDADGKKADVWSLAKTLWVLSTGQTFPPPGPQVAHYQRETIGAYVAHPRAHYLDRLIERATNLDPAARLSMSDIAAELGAWLAAPSVPLSPGDISDLAGRIAAVVAPAQQAEEVRSEQIKQAEQALRMVEVQLQPIGRAMAKTGACDGSIQKADDGHPAIWSPDIMGQPAKVWRKVVCIRVFPPSHPEDRFGLARVEHWCGVQLTLHSDGQLSIEGVHVILSAYGPQHIWGLWRRAPVGSAQQDGALAEITNGLAANLRGAVGRFLEWLEWQLTDGGRSSNPPGFPPRESPPSP